MFRSTQHIYAQIIDDTVGNTLVSASTLEVKVDGTKSDAAKAVGAAVAKKHLKKVSIKSFLTGVVTFIMAVSKLWLKELERPVLTSNQ